MNTSHSIEAFMIAASNKVTVVGGATAAIGGVADRAGVVALNSAHDIAGICAIGGLVCAVGGLIVSGYFQWRRDRREIMESELKRKKLMNDAMTD